jgi:hypothetical protein
MGYKFFCIRKREGLRFMGIDNEKNAEKGGIKHKRGKKRGKILDLLLFNMVFTSYCGYLNLNKLKLNTIKILVSLSQHTHTHTHTHTHIHTHTLAVSSNTQQVAKVLDSAA